MNFLGITTVGKTVHWDGDIEVEVDPEGGVDLSEDCGLGVVDLSEDWDFGVANKGLGLDSEC